MPLIVDRHWIGGEWIEGSGERVSLRSPIDREHFAEVRLCSEVDASLAVTGAKRALGEAADLDVAARANALRALASELEGRADEIALRITIENGCPSRQSQGLQVLSAVALLRSFATLVEDHQFEARRKGMRGGSISVQKVPVGVAVGISPWNVPIFLACMKIAPAIAAGCPLVLKPAPETATSNFVLGECVAMLDLPQGMLSVLTGSRDVGRALVSDARVAKVSFTGSLAGGREVASSCAARFARLTLELGGKSAAILLDDVDLAAALPGLLDATLQNNGQICGGQSRLLLPRARFDELAEALASAFRSRVVGDPRRENVDIGPLISSAQAQRVRDMVAQAKSQGARTLAGEDLPTGLPSDAYVAPTLLVGVDPDSQVAQTEVFGPVIVALPYDDEDDAVAIANSTPYGLAGSVWSPNAERAMRLARRVRSGTVSLNSKKILDFAGPFGGFGLSGIGRELGPEGIDAYLEHRCVLTSEPSP